MKQLIIASAMLLTGITAKSQQTGSSGKLLYLLDYQDIYSTHSDHFRGISFTVAKQVSRVLRLGAGAEYSAHSYHYDNDWNLYHLHFIPVFIDQQLKMKNSRRLYPVLHFAEGLTYLTYDKEIIANPGPIEHRQEVGVYLYGGTGLNWIITDKIAISAEAGIKGFRNSYNDLDVNPHGITGRLGIIFQRYKPA